MADCRSICFRARLADKLEAMEEGAFSSGTTHWLGPLDEPRCLLEQLAGAAFRAHTRDFAGEFDPAASGAEWWALTIDTDDQVGFHWDKDFALEEASGDNRTPAVATITYFSEVGAPTLMLEKAPPLRLGDPVDDGLAIERAWLSYPRPGKHVAFDGRWLHGAPTQLRVPAEPATAAAAAARSPRAGAKRPRTSAETLAGTTPEPQGRRVSLLVNVWLDHKPGLAERLPAAVAAGLVACDTEQEPLHLDRPSKVEPVPAHGACGDAGGGGGGGGGGGSGGGGGLAGVSAGGGPADDAAGRAVGASDGGTDGSRGISSSHTGAGAGCPAVWKDLSWPIVQENEAGCTLRARLPVARAVAMGRARPGASLALQFGPGEASILEG